MATPLHGTEPTIERVQVTTQVRVELTGVMPMSSDGGTAEFLPRWVTFGFGDGELFACRVGGPQVRKDGQPHQRAEGWRLFLSVEDDDEDVPDWLKRLVWTHAPAGRAS